MEDTLRVAEFPINNKAYFVLILVLMEDTLRAAEELVKSGCRAVLILVLMEDTLRGMESQCKLQQRVMCLNPCFNGRYSMSEGWGRNKLEWMS